MLRLLVTYGRKEEIFAVPEERARIGSASENDIVLRIPGISRYHALVQRCPGGVELIDQGSKNGILVGGARVTRAILTPGLRAQVGIAWIEVEELSSLDRELAVHLTRHPTRDEGPPLTTLAFQPQAANIDVSSPEAALQLAYHLNIIEANALEGRNGLIARFRTTLGAEVLASFKRQRNGEIELRECDGAQFSAEEERLLVSTSGVPDAWSGAEVRLKRVGVFLSAGRGYYFLAARFASEALAREGWRRDFLRFLAARFLVPAEPLRKIGLAEIRRVLMATGGNKSETARILGITRQTIYAALKTSNSKKSP
jgi:hypothetical protein